MTKAKQYITTHPVKTIKATSKTCRHCDVTNDFGELQSKKFRYLLTLIFPMQLIVSIHKQSQI